MFNKTSNPFARSTSAQPIRNAGLPTNPAVSPASPSPSQVSPASTTTAGANSQKTAPEPERKVIDESGSRLIVGPDVKLKSAEILDCDTLVVEGRVEATMDSRVIRIDEKGLYSGKVSIDIAEIRGQFEGELTARSQLIIHATGKVSGKIRYGKMLIEEGGQISGEIRSLADEEGAGSSRHRPEILASVKTAVG